MQKINNKFDTTRLSPITRPTLMKHPLIPRGPVLAVACLCSLSAFTGPLEAAPRFEALHGFELYPQQPGGSLVADAAGNRYGTSDHGAYGSGTIFKIAADGSITTLHHFDGVNGALPGNYLTAGSDGNFYGTSTLGGSSGGGNIYRITPAGEFTVLHDFSGGADGAEPCLGLLRAPQDGNFYGYTARGGANGLGTFFRITPDGVLTTMEDWSHSTVGWNPSANIIQGQDGNFYGINRSSMTGGPAIFRITPTGTASVVANFANVPNRYSAQPQSLIQASDGNFYGVNYLGVPEASGHVFKVEAGTVSVLAEFDHAEYNLPTGWLVEGADGMLYGTAGYGGTFGAGAIYRIGKSGGLSTFVSLNPESGGPAHPFGGVTLQPDGSFLGLSREGGANLRGTAFRVTPGGEVFVISSFEADRDCRPASKLMLASDGNLYGTTGSGVLGNGVFKLTPQGDVSIFPGSFYDTNGSYLGYNSGFVESDDGTILGFDYYGGEQGNGQVFSLDAGYQRVDFHTLGEGAGQGINGLIKGADGNFYGTTRIGGSVGAGTVFKLDPTGAFTLLAEFDWEKGAHPFPGLVRSADGSLYGTTEYDGTGDHATVFKVSPDGVLSTLAEFSESSGLSPTTGLMEASDGNFYGMTVSGGTDNSGTIYKVTPSGEITALHSFIWSAGGPPVGQLVEAADGAFYGATYGGLSHWLDKGSLFRITKAGEFSTVLEFDGLLDGGVPLAGLTAGNDGHLYGTTSEGGMTEDGKPAGGGSIFRLRFGAEVETGLATAIASSTATLNATVNPGGYATTVTFQYGTSPDLSSSSTISGGTLAAGDEPVNVAAELTGLAPGETYYFRVVAANDENPQPQSGETASFETIDPQEIVVATNNGRVLSDGSILVVGLTPVGNSADLTLSIANTSINTDLTGVGATISGSGAGHFPITGTPAETVPAASSTTCTVRFQPTSFGLKTADLTITSSDPDESPMTIHVYGIALPGFQTLQPQAIR
jgi:uncharacterized repeat protein (TIGR03803 family)